MASRGATIVAEVWYATTSHYIRVSSVNTVVRFRPDLASVPDARSARQRLSDQIDSVSMNFSATTEPRPSWPVRSIAELASGDPYSTQIGPFGKALMASEYTPTGVPVLRGVNVNRGRFHDDDFVFVSDETADRLAKFESFPDDVLLVHKGTLGQIGLMPKGRRYSRYLMGNSMMRVRCDRSQCLPEYLYYWLSSPAGQHYLFSRVSQVGVPQLQTPLSTLRQAKLPVPALEVQRQVVEVLGSLDDKIELNRRMNETLEAMARAIFKSWFVDFDPVRAKSEGRQPQGIPAHIADLFPSTFQDSPLGPIPKGWQVKAIGDVAECVGGSTPSTKETKYWEGGTVCFATPKDLSGLQFPVLLQTERHITDSGVEQISSGILPPGTVLLSSRAPIGYLAITETPVCVNQGFIAMKCRPELPNLYVLRWTEANLSAVVANANGSTFLEISKSNFRRLLVTVPSKQLTDAYMQAVGPLSALLVSNKKEDATLAKARDTLLPRLMSGERKAAALS